MKINSINNISTKGLPALKTGSMRNVSKARIIKMTPVLPKSGEKNTGKAILKELPQSTRIEDNVAANPAKQKRVSACGYLSDSCGGGFDFCGAYM